MSTQTRLALSLSLLFLASASGCVGQITQEPPGLGGNAADADPGDQADAALPPGQPASKTFLKVAVTALPGASNSAGLEGTFVAGDLQPGLTRAPALSNTVLSSVPGTPPKPIFVGQGQPMDAVLVAIEGHTGYYDVPAGGNPTIALDLVTQINAPLGTVKVLVATRSGLTISQTASIELIIDPHRFVAAGDLDNHDSDDSNVADLFGTFLEGKAGNPPAPTQVEDGEDNNQIIINGVKGPSGPLATGHREVVWDGVPEVLRNKSNFKAEFFDRQDNGAAGVRGGIIFTALNGSGQEVNDALGGATPDPATVGPPTNQNAAIGGDFSNINPNFAGNLLSFTQSASFAPLGTTTTEITFHVAGSQQKGIIHGMGIVFSSVDKPNTSYVEYFDESGNSIAKIFAPVQSHGPFPFEGPQVPDKFSYSFVGYNDLNARIAKVHVVNGDIAVDAASSDFPLGLNDVVVFDDVYYSEPTP